MEEICLLPDDQFQSRLHVSVQALPADVCGHGNLDRQRAPQKVKGLGHVDGTAVQEAISVQAHA
jgi:hypothetical protein